MCFIPCVEVEGMIVVVQKMEELQKDVTKILSQHLLTNIILFHTKDNVKIQTYLFKQYMHFFQMNM